jgi:putative Ig domain-containing protein
MNSRTPFAVVLIAVLLASVSPLLAADASPGGLVYQINKGSVKPAAAEVTGGSKGTATILVKDAVLPLEVRCTAVDCAKAGALFDGEPVKWTTSNASNKTAQLTLRRGVVSNLTLSFDGKPILQAKVTAPSCEGLGSAPPWVEISLVFVLGLLYWLAMVVVRWNRIAWPTRELLRAQITSLEGELAALPETEKETAANVKVLLAAARELISGTRLAWLPNFLFWSRGHELTGWGYVHEAETQMARLLRDETVTVRLEAAEQRLRAMKDDSLPVLTEAIRKELASPTTATRRQALLAQALAAIYSCEDNSYANLVSWQNKTSWLVGCGLVLVVALTAAIPHHSILFLVGATGGLLSRMSRSLYRKDVPTDYGASWTTLFLSPVAGGLGAWAGILLTGLATKTAVLGAAFAGKWDDPCDQVTLGIALLFGFSERLLDSVLDKLEGKAVGDQAAPAKIKPPQNGAQGDQGAAAVFAIKTVKLPEGKEDQPYQEVQLKAENASGKVKWSLKDKEKFPPGLDLAEDGNIKGKPSKAREFNFTVEASDEKGQKAQKNLAITIKPKT